MEDSLEAKALLVHPEGCISGPISDINELPAMLRSMLM